MPNTQSKCSIIILDIIQKLTAPRLKNNNFRDYIKTDSSKIKK